jgi:hypothetical protein
MARFTQAGGSGSGEPGPQGPAGNDGTNGADGADALWNFEGEWVNGVDYAPGSVVQFEGSSYYHPNGQFSSYAPPGYGWLLVSAKGDDGENGANGSNGSNGADGSPGLVYLGSYVSGNGYIANIAVVKGSDNNLYIATSSGGLGDPVGNSAEWSIFLPKGVDGEDAPLGTGANGEVTRWTPNFTATGLTFTGSGATHPAYNSHYVKNGRMVSFNIEVNLSTVTNFGTGQYKLQLPFTPQFGFNHFSGWIWADPNVDPDTGTGHTILNADTAGVTDVLDLHYLKQSGGANSPIREGLFLQGTPVTLSTISKIYVNGTYITSS